MRILKLVGIAVAAFVGLMFLFIGFGSIFGDAATSKLSDGLGDFVTIFVFIAVVALIVQAVRKKKE